ncbi:MAG: hypothetical protein IT558_03470 [Alphaproteobacteria bacterium]|nr:hypothetical protein [Alphaproteobacteria bacterium]
MPTHAEMAAKLLKDAAGFYKTLGAENDHLKKSMTENAAVYEQVAALVAERPSGTSNGKSHSAMAGELLRSAAGFFRTLGESNPPIREQMQQNAEIFEQMAALTVQDPIGFME